MYKTSQVKDQAGSRNNNPISNTGEYHDEGGAGVLIPPRSDQEEDEEDEEGDGIIWN